MYVMCEREGENSKFNNIYYHIFQRQMTKLLTNRAVYVGQLVFCFLGQRMKNILLLCVLFSFYQAEIRVPMAYFFSYQYYLTDIRITDTTWAFVLCNN